jgi:hypothetical protein
VYDLKIKGADLVAGTHGRSFWILDDISPLRTLSDGKTGTRIVAPRATIRTKLHFGALGGVRIPFSFAITFGIGGGIATTERPDGIREREHLDVGENPPNGAIFYYWLDDSAPGPLTLTFSDAAGKAIVTLRSDDDTLPVARRPGTRRGLNRFVWDMRYPGPARIDASLAPPRDKPLANEPEPMSGPTAVPGDYRVELTIGSESHAASFMIVKDPRLSTTPDDYARQFALLQQLYDKLSTLNGSVNRIRRIKRQLGILAERLDERHAELAGKVTSAVERMTAIEAVLVDVNRETPRDILRHPAGLNDTLVDMISTASMADMAPTSSAEAVSRETMTRVDAEIAKLDAMIGGELANVNRMAAECALAHVAA